MKTLPFLTGFLLLFSSVIQVLAAELDVEELKAVAEKGNAHAQYAFLPGCWR